MQTRPSQEFTTTEKNEGLTRITIPLNFCLCKEKKEILS